MHAAVKGSTFGCISSSDLERRDQLLGKGSSLMVSTCILLLGRSLLKLNKLPSRRKRTLIPALLYLRASMNIPADMLKVEAEIMLNVIGARMHCCSTPFVTLKGSEYSPWVLKAG